MLKNNSKTDEIFTLNDNPPYQEKTNHTLLLTTAEQAESAEVPK